MAGITQLGLDGTPKGAYAPFTGPPATSLTVAAIVGGESLTTLSYVLFDAADIGTGSIIKQANDETTDSSGDLVIDLTSLGVNTGTVLTVIITNYTTTPATTNRGAMCYGTAV